MMTERGAKHLLFLLFLFFGGLINLSHSSIHSCHQLLDPVVVWIGTDRLLFCLPWPLLHQKHNSSHVAITICFLYPVTFDVFLSILSHVINVTEAAVAKRPLCKTQAHAGEEQKKEKSLELHGCCCCCCCCSCCWISACCCC